MFASTVHSAQCKVHRPFHCSALEGHCLWVAIYRVTSHGVPAGRPVNGDYRGGISREIRKYGNNLRPPQIHYCTQIHGNTEIRTNIYGRVRDDENWWRLRGEVNPLSLGGSCVHTIYNCQRYLLSLYSGKITVGKTQGKRINLSFPKVAAGKCRWRTKSETNNVQRRTRPGFLPSILSLLHRFPKSRKLLFKSTDASEEHQCSEESSNSSSVPKISSSILSLLVCSIISLQIRKPAPQV